MSARAIFVTGAGGAGKSTTSAAIALASARTGQRTLLVTVDPARRLGDILEQPFGDSVQAYEPEPELAVWMPNTRTELHRLADQTMSPEVAREFADNPVTRAFQDAPSGLHEVVCILSLAEQLPLFDLVVVDTAPRDQAVSFFEAPTNLRTLLEGRAVSLFSRFGTGRGLGQRAIERVLDRVLPADVIADGAAFFRGVLSAREELAGRARRMQALMNSGSYVVVAAPDAASVRGAQQLQRSLQSQGHEPSVFLNRARLPATVGGASLSALSELQGARVLPWVQGGSRHIVERLATDVHDTVPRALPQAS